MKTRTVEYIIETRGHTSAAWWAKGEAITLKEARAKAKDFAEYCYVRIKRRTTITEILT